MLIFRSVIVKGTEVLGPISEWPNVPSQLMLPGYS